MLTPINRLTARLAIVAMLVLVQHTGWAQTARVGNNKATITATTATDSVDVDDSALNDSLTDMLPAEEAAGRGRQLQPAQGAQGEIH